MFKGRIKEVIMKKRTFIATVIVVNVSFLLLHIHKYNAMTELSYTKQRHEKECNQLAKQKQTLQQELCELHDKKTVTHYAQKYLSMMPVSLQQMRKLDAPA